MSPPRHQCARSSVDRALGCGPKGREFESRRARQVLIRNVSPPVAPSGSPCRGRGRIAIGASPDLRFAGAVKPGSCVDPAAPDGSRTSPVAQGMTSGARTASRLAPNAPTVGGPRRAFRLAQCRGASGPGPAEIRQFMVRDVRWAQFERDSLGCPAASAMVRAFRASGRSIRPSAAARRGARWQCRANRAAASPDRPGRDQSPATHASTRRAPT
jgi:hypothetical protein